uniref:Helicase ATP-binding domain-containing protein n=1 Tax=Bursaphelenchus xylophilus TaxID=6326 RepID=A0A1I7RJL1_BURXY
MAAKFKIPVEYQYLLEKKNIDQKTVEENKDLRHIFSHVPKNVPDRIRRNLAVISLHYANEYIQSKVPLFTNGVIRTLRLNFIRETRKVTVYRFDAEVLTPDHRKDDDYKQIPLQEFVALKEDDVEILSGRVYKSTKHLIRMKGTLVMSNSHPPPMPRQGATVNIYKAVIDFVPAAITKAIEKIQKGDLDEFIHPKPNMSSLKKFLKELDPQMDQFVTQNPEHARLNKEQKTAVYVISKGLHKPHPFVLFGPPGTGKTVTIIAAVVQLMKQDEGNRVLICTPSNTAADRVAKELLNHLDGELLGGHNVLRLCSRSVDFDHRDTSLDVIANIGAGEYEIPEGFKYYRIIITTLATSVRLLSETFTHIIADEAGQALEAEIWIPLGCCATKDTSVILCGDPNQLGPVNILNFPQRFSNYLECPLNWYLKMTDYAIDCRLCVRLVDCFRCHGHIVKIASNLFYKRRLRDAGDKEWKNKLCSDPSWFNGVGGKFIFCNSREIYTGCFKKFDRNYLRISLSSC